MAIVTEQQLIDAATDCDTLEAVVNGDTTPGTVTTRLGQVLKTLSKIEEEINEVGEGWLAEAEAAASKLSGTSATSVAIGLGSKGFVTQADKSFAPGTFLLIFSAADPTKYMHGQVSAYDATDGDPLTVTVTTVGGSGTFTDWVIQVSGAAGATGATGAAGSLPIADGAGTVDAITADFTPDISLADKTVVVVISAGPNTVTNPTFTPDGLTTRTIVTKGGQPLVAGDTGAAGYPMMFEYNLANTRWELMNPAKVVSADIVGAITEAKGGTGQTSYTLGDLLWASATNVLGKLGIGSALQQLRVNAAGNALEWATISGNLGDATESSGSSSITLTNSSNRMQAVTFTAGGKFVKLPDATTMSKGTPPFAVKNTGSYWFPIIDNSGETVCVLKPGEMCLISLSNNSTAKGAWHAGHTDNSAITTAIFGTAVNGVQDTGAGTTYSMGLAYIQDNKFLAYWITEPSTATARCAVVTITDADTLSMGTPVTFATTNGLAGGSGCIAGVGLDSSSVMLAYGHTSSSNHSAVIASISGSTVTINTAVQVSAHPAQDIHLFKIDANTVFYGYQRASSSYGVVVTRSGTTVTVNSITTVRGASGVGGQLSVAKIDAATYFFAQVGSTSYLDATVVTVSGTTVTSNTTLANSSNAIAVTGVRVIALNATTMAAFYTVTNNALYCVLFTVTGTTVTRLFTSCLVTLNPNPTTIGLDGILKVGNKVLLHARFIDAVNNTAETIFEFDWEPDGNELSLRTTSVGKKQLGQYAVNYAWPRIAYVAPGKFAGGYSPRTGTAYPGFHVYHAPGATA